MTTERRREHARKPKLQETLRELSPARLLPEETQNHLRNASREQLLAVRSLIDAAIDLLGPEEEEKPA